MGIAIVFARAVVMVGFGACVERRELFEPAFIILMKPRLVAV
jgi:hypothetical protein